jgi:Glycosyl transferase family 2
MAASAREADGKPPTFLTLKKGTIISQLEYPGPGMETAANNSSAKVSVIMPTYMTAHLIARALDSVLGQTFRDFEIVVVNDGSPDTQELEKVLAPYLDRIVYIKQPNKRAAGARNTAIHRARGEYLAFLDSDDHWLPEHLASQMQLFDQDPALDLVYCNGMVDTPESSREFMDSCPTHGEATFEALVTERCHVAVSTVVVRKQALERAGLFDQSLPRCDDYDMWLRAAFWGAKMGYSRKVQARFDAVRPNALSLSNIKMIEAQWQILEKAIKTLPLSPSQKKLVAQKASEIQGLFLREQGKAHLDEGRVKEAVEFFSQSNTQFPTPKVKALLLGLKVAPGATRKLMDLAKRMRSRETA